MARYIIFGAGSVGGLLGARLRLAGQEVVLVVRGAHRDAIVKHGLRLRTATTEDLVHLPVVSEVAEVTFRSDDRIVLAMKTQDVARALQEAAFVAPPGISIICAQNGIESERLALRLFERVYGIYVYVLAVLSEAGIVSCYSLPGLGILDIGRYPHGLDDEATAIAADFQAAGFDSIGRADIMKWKRGKLLLNTSNPIHAACAAAAGTQDIVTRARQEGEACFNAAHLDFISIEEVNRRAKEVHLQNSVGGRPYPGGSTPQGLARGAATSEVDFLNGEVVLLGRKHGVRTPVNSALQALMRDMVRTGARPGSLSAEELRQRITNAV